MEPNESQPAAGVEVEHSAAGRSVSAIAGGGDAPGSADGRDQLLNAQADYEPPERLRGLPTWLTGQAARRAHAVVAEVLSHDGVRRQHFSVLASLAERGPASQAEIGRRLVIDRSDLHGLLNELELRGLVARERDQHDRRRNVVALTAAGSAALDRLAARVQMAQDSYLEPLDDSERAELTRLLRKLVGS